ncbi:MAG: N-acetylmuramoyl-L-alanine amidase [Thermodesulfobacteriota bacterium]
MINKKRASFVMILGCVAAIFFSCASSSGNVKTRFFEAENCSQALSDNTQKQKYRSNWQQCINAFMGVYEQEPDGPWAAASLYRAAVLYNDLYGVSYRPADRQEAVDLFNRILLRFPDSAYTPRAKEQLAAISGGAPAKVPVKTPAVTAAPANDRLKARYDKAERAYKSLQNTPAKQKYRSAWQEPIDAYYGVYEADPSGPLAADSLYMAGRLHVELRRHSFRKADQDRGVELLGQVARDFPGSPAAAKAIEDLKAIPGAFVPAAAAANPLPKAPLSDKDLADTAPEPYCMTSNTAPVPEGQAVVEGLRFWSNPAYTRVVIDTSKQVTYTHNLLKHDPAQGKLQRLYLDLDQCKMGKDLSRNIPVDDNLLKDIRTGQYTLETVRVVVDIKSFEDYDVFHLQNPFRIVIDVRGENGKRPEVAAIPPEEALPPSTGPRSLAEQLSLGVRRIVIDAGHGGRDGGAPGYRKGVHEKAITLSLARKLADQVRREIGCEVILTRSGDSFLTLEERTAIANTKNADLFVSIHTNACRSNGVYGIETYILNIATDEDAMEVAARENATSTKNISDLQMILRDLMQNTKINESSRLAGFVQTSLCGHLKKNYSRIKDKGVKQAPFYVLLGAQMPAILIEAGFISDKTECDRLANESYQNKVCEGIVKGIKDYMRHTKMAVFSSGGDG